jgi:putative tRNA adenosine deaminase-associated protein
MVESVDVRSGRRGEDRFAVAAVREDARWRCTRLGDAALVDLDTAIAHLSSLRPSGTVLGLLALDLACFVLLRPKPPGVSLMVSDAVAALDVEMAASVLRVLGFELPPTDAAEEEPWPEGDMDILADLGLPSDDLYDLARQWELYPDEQLAMIARRCGFGEEFARAVGGPGLS